MKNGLSTAMLLAATMSLGLGQSPKPNKASKPNVLFILCDDLGYGDLGSFGQTHFKTPNLDRLAAEGTRLTEHHAGAPVCAPSRACLLLGVSSGHVPVRDHQFDREIPDTNTMASVLGYAGYRTLAIGKWGLGGTIEDGFPAHPQKRGFDAWYGLYRHNDGHVHYPDAKHPLFDGYANVTSQVQDCYSTDLYTAKAKQWIIGHVREKPTQPFFMYLAYIAPHEAFDIPDGPYPAGGGLTGGLSVPLQTHPESKNKWIYPEFRNATYHDDNNPLAPEKPWTWQMQHYATMIRRIDQGVGDLVQTLRDLKIDKNTLIVFTSDNGPAYDDGLHPTQFISWGILDGFKRDLFEGGFREPTIVWWPGVVRKNAVIRKPSVQYDWLPTFAELAGVVPPAESDGNSLARSLTGRGTSPSHDYFYFEFHGPSNRIEDRQVLGRHGYSPANGPKGDPWGQQQAVRMGSFVGVRVQIQDANTPIRLYNVDTDPHEDHDLSNEPRYAGLIRQMRDRMLTARLPQAGNPRPYDEAPLPALPLGHSVAGLSWKAYPDPTPWAPDVRDLKAFAGGKATSCVCPTLRSGPLTVVFTGRILIPTTGAYTFRVGGGTTAHVWIHDAHVLDSEADFANPRRANTVRLEAGSHPVRIEVTFHGDRALNLDWQTPGAPEFVPVPASAFVQ